jgi:hypothetical protein
MLYTTAEAAQAMGLEESVILSAIEQGQITSTKDVSGEWHIEESELHALYLSIAQGYCREQWRADKVGPDTRDRHPDMADVAENNSSVEQKPMDAPLTADRTGAAPRIAETTAPAWQDEIRIDGRDRLVSSHLGPAVRPARTRIIRAAVVLTFGCVVMLSWFCFFGRSQFPAQTIKASGPLLDTQKDMRGAGLEPVATVVKTAPGTLMTTDQPRELMKNLHQAPSPSPAVTQTEAIAMPGAAKKRESKIERKLVPVPETGPTTIPGWTVRSVVNGIATLDGPGGTLKAARGDTLPGLGKVDSVVLWGHRWIVSTTRGLISTP